MHFVRTHTNTHTHVYTCIHVYTYKRNIFVYERVALTRMIALVNAYNVHMETALETARVHVYVYAYGLRVCLLCDDSNRENTTTRNNDHNR